MKSILLPILLILSILSHSQERLSASLRSSAWRWIYVLTPQEAETLFNKGLENVEEKYLHRLVDSIPFHAALPDLPAGNYITVHVQGNRLSCELISIGDVEIKMVNNHHDLSLVLHHKKGRPIQDASVSVNNKKLPFDPSTQTYRLKNYNRKGSIRVVHQNTIYYFPLQKNQQYNRSLLTTIVNGFPIANVRKIFRTKGNRYFSYFHHQTSYEKKFRGFMTFSKPVYMPGDTVKLKAFVMNKRGVGVKNKLLVRLTSRNFDVDTIIASISPYRPGGYLYEFVLTDSLDIDLDEDYLLTLEEVKSRKYNLDDDEGEDDDDFAAKRKVLMRGKFKYEEYELQSLRFSMRTDKERHFNNDSIFLFFKATDENDLPLMDGRLQVFLSPATSHHPQFHAARVFLPDTLWQHELLLETSGETKLKIPLHIFPAASFQYKIKAVLLNSSNERKTQEKEVEYFHHAFKLDFKIEEDSVLIFSSVNQNTSSQALLLLCDKFKPVDSFFISLPAKIPLHPFVSSYVAKWEGHQSDFHPVRAGLVKPLAERTKDSLFIEVSNPHKLPFWYTIFSGKKVVERGYAKNLSVSRRTGSEGMYSIAIQYIFANKVHHDEWNIPYHDKLLKVAIHAPPMVHPGQQVKIQVEVKGPDGRPVEDADVTAYSFTGKFNAGLPGLPYLGKQYAPRKKRSGFYAEQREKLNRSVKLDWQKWNEWLGLDAIEYYKFLFTKDIYRNYELANGRTAFAPFVVMDGSLQAVHLIYVDEKPVYFSHVQTVSRYSIPVDSGMHKIRIRTHNREIFIDSLRMEQGQKNIIGIHADAANPFIRISKMPDTLTHHEKALVLKYSIVVNQDYGERYSYISQGDHLFFLPPKSFPARQSNVLVGPLMPWDAEMNVVQHFKQWIEVEGGYQYFIKKNFIKQKQADFRPYFRKLKEEAESPVFQELAWTEIQIDSLWQQYLDNRSANTDLFHSDGMVKGPSGELVIAIEKEPDGSQVFIKNIFLFSHDNTDFLKIYKGNTRNVGKLPEGRYRLYLLLKDNGYILEDSIQVKENGKNYFLVKNLRRAKDSTSQKLSDIMNNRSLENLHDRQDLEKIRNNFNSSYMDVSGWNNFVQGKVVDDKGMPVPFAMVKIKGTQFSVTADASGSFYIKAPTQGTLEISSVGYHPYQVPITNAPVLATLHYAKNSLQEVVVVGYGASRKKELTASFSTQSLEGRAAGIMIRGNASLNSHQKLLVVIDGVPVEQGLEDLDPSLFGSVTVLKEEAASAIYGARAANGAILITTKGAMVNEPMPQQGNSTRRRFRDDAYWQPALRTNKKGIASFMAVFPDDITSWKTYAMVVAGNKGTGSAEGIIKSFRPLSANLSLPHFAVEGDSLDIIGKSLNYSADTVNVKRSVYIDDSISHSRNIQLSNAHLDTIHLVAPPKDSIALKIEVEREDGYYDGEERKIPVFKKGVLETNGIFAVLDKDTSLSITMDPSHGKVIIYAEASVLPVLLDEAEKVINYEYLCNEQLASKLKTLLVKRKIYRYMNKPFTEGNHIVEIISKLNSGKKNNLWGWWTNNDPLPWISLHVVSALLEAEKEGFAVQIPKQQVIDHLVHALLSYSARDQLLVIDLLQKLEAKFDYREHLLRIEKKSVRISLYDKLRWIEVAQHAGMNIPMDSILGLRKQTMFGNYYWGEEGHSMFDNSIHHTVMVYRMGKKAGVNDSILKKIRYYFLEKRKSGQWRNTYESSLILEAIAPDLFTEENARPSKITVGNETITIFPFRKEWNGESSFSIQKRGGAPVYVTAFQQLWNSEPLAVAAEFVVNSRFMQSGKPVVKLKAGEPVILYIDVEVTGDADYVMIEVPVPAGCSYKDKTQPKTNNEVHREYFKNKVGIFCSSLKKGKYTFSISLLPRFTGRYHLNPAKAEMMYFPLFFGREAIRKIKID